LKVFQTYLPERVIEWIRERAQARGISESEFIRGILVDLSEGYTLDELKQESDEEAPTEVGEVPRRAPRTV
jgi:hypothetical protein